MAKILLIDDSEEVRKLAGRILRKEHEVSAVEDWVQAAPLMFRDRSFDMVLIDVNMPTVQGDQIAEITRKTMVNPPKLVLFSAMDEDELRKKAESVGADGWISKTFKKDALLGFVRRALDAKASSA